MHGLPSVLQRRRGQYERGPPFATRETRIPAGNDGKQGLDGKRRQFGVRHRSETRLLQGRVRPEVMCVFSGDRADVLRRRRILAWINAGTIPVAPVLNGKV